MTFEEEQLKYAEELKKISVEFNFLHDLFSDPSQVENKIWDFIKKSQVSLMDTKYLSDFQKYQEFTRIKSYLENEYREKKSRKKELEYLLSQTPAERTKDKTLNKIGEAAKFVSSITPEHVSGRVYRVENGNGCAMFCIWFLIIDVLIIFIYYLCTEVH